MLQNMKTFLMNSMSIDTKQSKIKKIVLDVLCNLFQNHHQEHSLGFRKNSGYITLTYPLDSNAFEPKSCCIVEKKNLSKRRCPIFDRTLTRNLKKFCGDP